MKRAFVAGLLAVVVPLWAYSAVAQTPPPNALQGYVTRVIDGETIYVAFGNQIEKVRYIGIHTPEIHHPTKGKQPDVEAAHLANARLVDGRWVHLVLDVQQRDSFGRLLAYVYVGNRLVNGELVWQGYAEAATHPPNVRYADYFVSLQRQAREARRGLWAAPETVTYHRSRPPESAEPPQSPTSDQASGPASAGGPSVSIPGTTTPAFRGSSPGSMAPASGGDVNVRGYTRGDGSYVGPHTRSRPGR